MADEIKNAFDNAFRDYVSTGIPSSGKYKVKKSEVRSAGRVIQSTINEYDAAIAGIAQEVSNLLATVTTSTQWKTPVRAASTANVNLANGLENGDTIDGVTLATGNRVLLLGQTAPAENGIYTVVSSGAASRSADADLATEVLFMASFVQEGAANGSKAYILTTPGPITLGTTALNFTFIFDIATLVPIFSYLLDTIKARPDGLFTVSDEYGNEILGASTEDGVSFAGMRAVSADGFHWVLKDERGNIIAGFDETGPFGFTSGDDSGSAYTPTSGAAARIWTGALQPDGFTVACDVDGGTPQSVAQIEVSTDQNFLNVVQTTPATVPYATEKFDGSYWKSIKQRISGLLAGTQYFYRARVDGLASPAISVKTVPASHVATAFSILLGSCNEFGADPGIIVPSYRAMAKETGILGLLHMGDIDYSDVTAVDIKLLRSRNERHFRSNNDVAALLRKIPLLAYMYDDHDYFGGNDNDWDSSNPGGAIRRQVYRETTPHYPFIQQQLGETDPAKILPVQVFDIGKARFVMLDTRSQRRLTGGATMLGNGTNPPGSWNQLGWFTGTFLPQAATDAAAGDINRLFIVSPTGWTGAVYDGWQDGWSTEQTAICNAVVANPNLPPMTILNGDFHSCAVDDGTNTDFSTAGSLNTKLTQIMASPFMRDSKTGGGPYVWDGVDSHILTAQGYCRLDVRTDGSWLATFKGAPFDGTYTPTVLGTFDTNDL
ncbi:hypothetical protein [Rhizobium sp. Root482]|uniref:hypothetical protein n=1 Tax=Rhizobium sp. Root482 TaxID=1736543 RepID=UPI0006FE0A4B|nr:hypothetical protein [Rhizobium sp. Root482]KQY27173.1 hypothetical protein ASD31_03030 [Rhizobium sp. Root482]